MIADTPIESSEQCQWQPKILAQLRQLDSLLRQAVARARLLYAAGEGDEAFHGVYISEQEIDALLARAGAETLAGDEALAEPLADFLSSSELEVFSTRWQLTAFDNAVLLLALAPEVDLRYERIYAYLQDDVTRRRPTVDLALNLFCDSPEARLEQRRRFAPEAPLKFLVAFTIKKGEEFFKVK